MIEYMTQGSRSEFRFGATENWVAKASITSPTKSETPNIASVRDHPVGCCRGPRSRFMTPKAHPAAETPSSPKHKEQE
jgi:hypothetical protein